MHTVDAERYRAAAEAAGARAEECRARREKLRAHSRVGKEDVAHAREALERAHRRADIAIAAASVRSDRLRGAGAPTATASLVSSLSPVELGAWVSERGIALDDLHVKYLSLGGVRTLFELDAFANGVVDFGSDQRGILAHAMWELDEFRA